MKTKRLSVLVSVFAIFGMFGCAPAHTHNYVLVPEVAATCATTGTEAYYKCDSCSDIFDMTKQKITEPTIIEKDANNHKGTKVLAIDTGYKSSYTVGDTFDMSNVTLRWKCDSCNGVALTTTEKSMVTIAYPTQGATSFTTDDVQRGVCKVTLSLNSYRVEASVTVGKHVNEITGLTAQEGHCGYRITELDNLELVASSGEDVDLWISETIDGTYTKRSELSDTTVFNVKSGEETTVWYLKATSEATAGYTKAETDPVTLTITHNEILWDTSRDDYDFVGCLCKPDEVIKYQKTPTNESEVLLTESTAALDLTGTSYAATQEVKSIKINILEGEPIDLGTDITAIPTSDIKTAEIFGATEIEVVVNTAKDGDIPACDHIIKVPAIVITAKITNASDWASKLIPSPGVVIKGYYLLTSDITCATTPAWVSGWDTGMFSGIIDGDGHKVTLGEGPYGQFYFLKEATIKDVDLYCNWYRRTENKYCLLANKCLNTTFDNVNILKPAVASGQGTAEYIAGQDDGFLFNNGGFQGCIFNECDFDFEEIQVPVLFCHSSNNSDSNLFSNCTMKCAGIGELFSTKDGSITEQEGLTITIEKAIILDQDPINVDMTSNDPVTITLPTEYQDYTIQSIKHETADLGTDLTNVVIPNDVKADPQKHGETYFNIVAIKETTKVKLAVPAIFITKKITTIAEVSALTHQNGSQATVYGYYLLMNNLNFNSDYTEFSGSNWNWFHGTFDGNGKTITSKSRPFGLFGGLDGAKLKNFTINDAWCYGGIDNAQSVISQDMKNTTLENVTVNCTAKANRNITNPFPITNQNYGWVNCRICMDCKFINCTFNGSDMNIQTLLGTHSSCVRNTFTNSTFTCGNYYCIYQSQYTSTVTTTATGLTISGNCVYTA